MILTGRGMTDLHSDVSSEKGAAEQHYPGTHKDHGPGFSAPHQSATCI